MQKMQCEGGHAASPTNSGEPPLDYGGSPTYLIPATTMALAAEPIPHGIRGQYAFTGAGTALIAPLGFETNLRPKGPPGAYIYQTFSTEGVYTFERDGTGSFKGLNHLATFLSQHLTQSSTHNHSPFRRSVFECNILISLHYG
jgi:hypothetical protein